MAAVAGAAVDLEPFRALVALAEAECALIAGGRAEELAPLQDEWTARLAALPPATDPDARALLERAAALQATAGAGLRAAAAAVAAELAGLDRDRAGVRAYAPPGAAAPSPSFDRAA